MQPHPDPADNVGRLVNGGANDLQQIVANGLESSGVDRDAAQLVGHNYAGALMLIIVAIYIRYRYFSRVSAAVHPPPKKKGKGKKK